MVPHLFQKPNMAIFNPSLQPKTKPSTQPLSLSMITPPCYPYQTKPASTSMSNGRKITLKSSDGKTFEVDEEIALESQKIKDIIENIYADNAIPLPYVTGKILSRVIEFCKKHVETHKTEHRPSSIADDLKAWDSKFVKVDEATAANELNIKSLFYLAGEVAMDMVKGMTPKEIRKTFNNKIDFSPVDEEEFRRMTQCWFE